MADHHDPTPPPDRDLYTIPAKSSWFRWDEIHETEKTSLPEFFDGSSISRNPRVYKEYRDFIINKYREDPARKLTFTDLRRSLVGDAVALHKVFAFLDRWGLVNFSVGGKEQAAGSEGFPAVVVEDGPQSGVRVVGQASVAKGGVGEKTVGGRGFRLPPLTSYPDVLGNGKAGAALLCGNCGEWCVSGRYESKKENLIICTKCFKIEDNNALKSANDLMFVDNINGNSKMVNNEWSDIETLHLLEGIIAKKNDWALVSDQARRTKLDCIVRLIQLPLVEHVSDTINAKYDGRNLINRRSNEPSQYGSGTLKKELAIIDGKHHMDIDKKEKLEEDNNVEQPLKRRRMLSWPDATDSLMRQVANVSTVAGPHIAAAAAEAAIMALCSESPYAKKVFKIENEIDNEFNIEPDGCTDPMDAEILETEKQSEATAKPGLVKNFGHLTFKMRAAIATAFGSVAAHAKLLADQEDREIEHLMASILEMQVKKIQCKIKCFDELESIMEKEYIQIQQLKESILSEWIDILQKANGAGISKWRGKGFSKPVSGHTF